MEILTQLQKEQSEAKQVIAVKLKPRSIQQIARPTPKTPNTTNPITYNPYKETLVDSTVKSQRLHRHIDASRNKYMSGISSQDIVRTPQTEKQTGGSTLKDKSKKRELFEQNENAYSSCRPKTVKSAHRVVNFQPVPSSSCARETNDIDP